jgi:hypothetical protein
MLKARRKGVIGKDLAIESGWYFAVGISIPLVIWFIATHVKELKGYDNKVKKEKMHTIPG